MHNNSATSNYLMCEKRKCQPIFLSPFLLPPSTPPPPSHHPYESWEEQAFARDSAGDLGGYVWPPRSYACSFCRREFRSAQALGGHMNVHRRDRARLNQAPSSISTQDGHETNYHPNPNANNAPSFFSPVKEIYSELGGRRRIRDFLYDEENNDEDGMNKKMNYTDVVFSDLTVGRQINGSGEFVKSHHDDQEPLKLSFCPVEELDLELRLGEKIK